MFKEYLVERYGTNLSHLMYVLWTPFPPIGSKGDVESAVLCLSVIERKEGQ